MSKDNPIEGAERGDLIIFQGYKESRELELVLSRENNSILVYSFTHNIVEWFVVSAYNSFCTNSTLIKNRT